MIKEISLNTVNQKLLREVKEAGFKINFVSWDEPNMGAFIKNKEVKIQFGTKPFNQACITHELLHVKMKSYNYISANYLNHTLDSSCFLSKVFDKNLCDYISNVMDHVKMFPLFLELGYKPEEFLSNGNNKLVDLYNLKRIRINRWWKLSALDVNKFIGNLMAILADHLQNDYTEELKVLRLKDPKLFKIVNRFWNNWLEFDIENIHPVLNSDIELLHDFLKDLKSWVETK